MVQKGNQLKKKKLDSQTILTSHEKVLKRVKQLYAALAMEAEMGDSSRSRKQLFMLGRCITSPLPEVVIVQAVHKKRIMLKRRRNSFSINEVILKKKHSCSGEIGMTVFGETESYSYAVQSSKDVLMKVPLKSISIVRRELQESNLGWPLCQRTAPLRQGASRRSKARSMSLVEWVMNLPIRSCDRLMQTRNENSEETNISSNDRTLDYMENNESEDRINSREEELSSNLQEMLPEESTLCWPLLRVKTSVISDSLEESEARKRQNGNPQTTDITPKSHIDLAFKAEHSPAENETCLEVRSKEALLLKLKSTGCKHFKCEELKRATHKFSTENLIGEGGCSNVYKGRIGLGKLVAVKVLKQYKEAWSDFVLEVEIMTSLKHKHITHLVGICIEDNHLILVYEFLPKGNLEERLQGHNTLPWKVRNKVAIAVTEALHYLHSVCSNVVIHRDVKSSNILLSSDFQPQLSDFGCATWGPKAAAKTFSSDIVGTFGYIAPEYFMHGKVSDKTDIYSFGIVLLELLTGKKAISSKSVKGEESLVKWAVPLLESGNLEALLDPKLGKEFDIAQLHRIVLAATLCIKQSPRLRPNASQILKLLKEEKEVREWMKDYVNQLHESSYEEFDDTCPVIVNKPTTNSSSVLVLDNDASSLDSDGDTNTKSITGVKQNRRFRLKDYLDVQQD